MANALVALGGANPQINSMQSFDQSQANELNARSTRMAQQQQALEWLGAAALGTMDGKLDGAPNPERWGQVVDQLAGQGVDASIIEKMRADPGYAPVLARSSMSVMQQLANARDEREEQRAIERMNLDFQRYEDEKAARAAAENAPTANMRDYQFAQDNPGYAEFLGRGTQQGYATLSPDEAAGLGLDPKKVYQRAPDGKISDVGGSLVTVNTGTPSDGKLREALDTNEGKQWSEYKTAGTVSSANAQDFQVLDELIGMAPQGPITGRLSAAFPGVNAAGDAFQSIVKRIAPTLRAPGSGSTSDIEYSGMLQSLPALQNDPTANRMILSIMKAKAEINMQRAEVVTQYQTGDLTATEARQKLNELDRTSVLTPEMRQALIGVGGSGEVGNAVPNAGDVVDGYRFIGGNPADRNSWAKVN